MRSCRRRNGDPRNVLTLNYEWSHHKACGNRTGELVVWVCIYQLVSCRRGGGGYLMQCHLHPQVEPVNDMGRLRILQDATIRVVPTNLHRNPFTPNPKTFCVRPCPFQSVVLVHSFIFGAEGMEAIHNVPSRPREEPIAASLPEPAASNSTPSVL